MTPLLWLAATIAYIAVFAYFVWGLGYRAYWALRDHRTRLRTDIEYAIECRVRNRIKRPRFALSSIKTLVLLAVMIPVVICAGVVVIWLGVSAWTALVAMPPTVVLLILIYIQLVNIASKL